MQFSEDEISLDASVSKAQIDKSSADGVFVEEIGELCERLFTTLVEKNSDYGSSFIERGEREAAGPSPVNDNAAAILNGLRIRSGDKQQRFERLLFEGTEGIVPESMNDTTLDAAGYWLLKLWVLEYYD